MKVIDVINSWLNGNDHVLIKDRLTDGNIWYHGTMEGALTKATSTHDADVLDMEYKKEGLLVMTIKPMGKSFASELETDKQLANAFYNLSREEFLSEYDYLNITDYEETDKEIKSRKRMKRYTINYSETYEGTYTVIAGNYKKAKEALSNALMEGKLDGPDECMDSHYNIEDMSDDIDSDADVIAK